MLFSRFELTPINGADDTIAAILDWEDDAIGDRLSDLACSRLELRYKFGLEGMQAFTETYGSRLPID